MPKELSLELKVGAFVLAAVVCLTLVVFSISSFSFFEKGQKMHVVFGYANGLKKAAPVRLAGVEAGVVKAIDVYTEPRTNAMKVKVDISVDEDIRIPVDSVISINQLGLLGEKYVEITPGQSGQMMVEGGTLVGIDPVPVEKITKRIDSLTSKLEQAMESINTGVLTEKNKLAFSQTLEGLSGVMTKLNQGQGTIGQLIGNPSMYNNLDELTADLKNNPWKLLYRPRPAAK
jgi:phospholipid/cholesterol/gamma-HCH transport system substrate-binding protein